MNTIAEYIKWRGDLTFEQSPLNEVDSYIIAKIGTMDLKGVVPEGGESIGIGDALELYMDKMGERAAEIGILASKHIFPAVQGIASSERFKDLRLAAYVSRVNNNTMEQFSALSILFPDGRVYVSFRGTDDSIVGWKENFMLAVDDEVPAQKDALAYLMMVSQLYDGRLIVGGHSKGGNLAVYASAMAIHDIQDRIDIIYSFDGPGFKPGFTSNAGYMNISGRIKKIIPQYSLVGTLLECGGKPKIVNSFKVGPAAHDGFVWEVMGPSFVECPELSRSSRTFDESLDKVLDEMTAEEKKEFIDEFFNVIEDIGVDDLKDMTENGLRKALNLMKSLRKASKTREFAGEVLEQMMKAYAAEIGEKRITLKKLQNS